MEVSGFQVQNERALTCRAGQGTAVHIKIPLTLAIIPGMVGEGGGERFVIPQVSLVELVRLEEEQALERIERIHGAPVCRLRGKLLPLVYLNETLELDRSDGQRREDSVREHSVNESFRKHCRAAG